MHKTVILWLAAVVITFLTGYIYNITDWTYPVSGTIGVEGYKVSYMFDKVHYGPDPYQIIIRTDIPGLEGTINWKFIDENGLWQESELKSGNKILKGEIPFSRELNEVEYKVVLNFRDKEYSLAAGSPVSLVFYSKVPAPVKIFNGLITYLILFLSVRTMMEAFNVNQKIKKYSFVTVVVALFYTAMIHPLYLSYKYGYINHAIPPIGNLFPAYSLLFLLLWIASAIIHFKAENPKPFAASAGLLTITIYLMVRF